jgi:hypothetical protein
MKYLCLIYDSEKLIESLPKPELQSIFGEYGAFTQDITKSGGTIWAGTRCSRCIRLPRFVCATAKSPRRMARLPRPRSNSADTIWWKPRI